MHHLMSAQFLCDLSVLFVSAEKSNVKLSRRPLEANSIDLFHFADKDQHLRATLNNH